MADTLLPEEAERLAAMMDQFNNFERRNYVTQPDAAKIAAALRELTDCKRMLAEADAAIYDAHEKDVISQGEYDRFIHEACERHASRLAAAKEKPNG